MQITHVIRAEGHVSNTPVQCLLYDALGWKLPIFAHLPSVLSADGKGKLSKRLGALSMVEYRRQGYLPDALVNYMALLGWSPGDDREMLSRDELIQTFDLGRVKKGSARFDAEKLLWMNQKYIKQASGDRLAALAAAALKDSGLDPSALDPAWLKQLVEVYRDGLKSMSELPAQVRFLLVDRVEYDPGDVEKFLLKDNGLALLGEIRRVSTLIQSSASPAARRSNSAWPATRPSSASPRKNLSGSARSPSPSASPSPARASPRASATPSCS